MQILTYLFIFVAKLIEVSLATVRQVLVIRGEKVKAAILAFFEAFIWVLVVSNVLQSISEDPIKIFVYCLAFALGIYCGVILEDKLAIGTVSVQTILPSKEAEGLSVALRQRGFGVTTVDGHGMGGDVTVLMAFVKRKMQIEVVASIKELAPNAPITINDVRHIRNAFIK